MKRNSRILILFLMLLLLGTGCGRRSVSIDENYGIDLGIEEEKVYEEIEEEVVYVKAGEIIYNLDDTIQSWSKCEYDEENKLVKEWNYYSESDENYSVSEYDEHGNIISSMEHYDGMDVSGYSYVYEYDEAGRKLSAVVSDGDGNEMYRSEYSYDSPEAAMVERQVGEDGSIYEVYEYDAEGHLLKLIYGDPSQAAAWYNYEYDEKWNLVRTIFWNGVEENTTEYKNEYSDTGELENVTVYNQKGDILWKRIIFYEDVEKLSSDWNLANMTSLGEPEEEELVQEESGSQDGELSFAKVEEMIYADVTRFTFGECSPRHMTVKDVELIEEGEDEDGGYFYRFEVKYDSKYGEFIYLGEMTFKDNANGISKVVDSRLYGMGGDNPKVDWTEIDKEYLGEYLWYGDYGRVREDKYGDKECDWNHRICFSSGYGTTYIERTEGNDRFGLYTCDPSDKPGYDFKLKIYWDMGEERVCEVYYGKNLDEKYIIELYPEYYGIGISEYSIIYAYLPVEDGRLSKLNDSN